MPFITRCPSQALLGSVVHPCQGHRCRVGNSGHPSQKGGDPLSVVIFDTVMNTLLDTVSLRTDLGYRFSNSRRRVNILQYADDTCVVANSPASCPYLLDTTSISLQWSGMSAKIPKCQCLSLQGSSGKLVDPHLTLAGMPIPFSTGPVRFMGMDIQVPKNSSAAWLQEMLQAVVVDEEAEAEALFWRGVSTPVLATDDPGVPHHLDGTAGCLSSHREVVWAWKVSQHSSPRSLGGLNLPSPSTLQKRLQVSRQCQLLISPDSCVRFLAERGLKQELQEEVQTCYG